MSEFNFCDSLLLSLKYIEENIDIIPPFMFPVLNIGLDTLNEYIKSNKN